jgi:phosphatidylglycerophosphate synthase
MSPDIGLYDAKYAMRRWIVRAPGVKRLQPNAVSIASILPSALAAVALWSGWWPLVCLGILGRMLLTVADGLIAEEFDRRTRIGPYVNRLPQDMGDAALFAACLAWADPAWVVLLMGSAWLVNVAGSCRHSPVARSSRSGRPGSRTASRSCWSRPRSAPS